MKRICKLENLDCANCAAKMERAISRIPGVEHATVQFMTQRLTIEAEESQMDGILAKAAHAVQKIERNCKIIL